MGRMTRRTKEPEPEAQTDAVVGRDLIEQYQRESEEMADSLTLGETVQYYEDGWRVGKIETLPDADEPKYGRVRVEHAITGKTWVAGRDVRKIK